MIFTRHAIERYRQFHMLDRPTATDEDARNLLERFGPVAVHTGAKTHLGDPVWLIEGLGIEVVCKKENGIVTCVTVLPPPRFRGLTPLQAEIVEASLHSVKERSQALELRRTELRAQAPKPGIVPADLAAEQRRTRTLEDLNPLARIAQAEQLTLAAVLKTMRVQLTAEDNASRRKAALKLAVQYLRAARDPGAHEVLAAIAEIDPGLVSAAFIDGESPGEP